MERFPVLAIQPGTQGMIANRVSEIETQRLAPLIFADRVDFHPAARAP
jgi:hypothetical protein